MNLTLEISIHNMPLGNFPASRVADLLSHIANQVHAKGIQQGEEHTLCDCDGYEVGYFTLADEEAKR